MLSDSDVFQTANGFLPGDGITMTIQRTKTQGSNSRRPCGQSVPQKKHIVSPLHRPTGLGKQSLFTLRTIRNTVTLWAARTSQETYFFTTQTNRIMLFGETDAVYCVNHMEHIDTLCGQNAGSIMLKQVVHIVTTDF
jgi:hypothetical protein